MFSLQGKTAIVTGGNTGIGKGIALALAKAGADVGITSYTTQGDETVAELQALGRKAATASMDGADSSSVTAAIGQLAEALGGTIDILVNNAGHLIGRVAIAEMSDEHWHRVIDVNLSSSFYAVRAALPFMRDGGRIITMSSLAAHNGGGNGAVAYAASKAGVLGLTYGLAKELAPRQITVNAVAPGLILGTPFHVNFNTEAGRQAAIAGIPLQKPGFPEDVAAAVLYLVSDEAHFITGEVIEINGGALFR